MNSVNLVGRLVRDPELHYSTGENATASCRFTVAVQRKFKNADGNYDADFISCVAFRQTAETISKFFTKGSLIGIQGNIRTGSYTNKDGNKVYTTDVYVDNFEFVGSKADNGGNSVPTQQNNTTARRDNSFMNIPDGSDEELPF